MSVRMVRRSLVLAATGLVLAFAGVSTARADYDRWRESGRGGYYDRDDCRFRAWRRDWRCHEPRRIYRERDCSRDAWGRDTGSFRFFFDGNRGCSRDRCN